MTDIQYQRQVIDDTPVVAAPAEIDITTADQLHTVLLQAIRSAHPAIVVDLTRTRFCDSAGLHVLVRAHTRARAESGELRLVVPADGSVHRIMTLTGMDRSIPCFASLKEALAQTPAGADP